MIRLVGPLWEGTTRAKDSQGTPTQGRISPGVLVLYKDRNAHCANLEWDEGAGAGDACGGVTPNVAHTQQLDLSNAHCADLQCDEGACVSEGTLYRATE